MTVADNLRASKALISKPENWCTRFYAVDENGVDTFYDGPYAVSWCARSAVWCHDGSFSDDNTAMACLRAALPTSARGIAKYNDSHKHPAIMEWFDRAIKIAEQRHGE